jgi:hypothetical protein
MSESDDQRTGQLKPDRNKMRDKSEVLRKVSGSAGKERKNEEEKKVSGCSVLHGREDTKHISSASTGSCCTLLAQGQRHWLTKHQPRETEVQSQERAKSNVLNTGINATGCARDWS